MKIAVLFSNYMYSYIPLFLELCRKNNIEIDFFKFAHDKVSFDVKAKNKYIIYSKWKAKKFETLKKIEDEIKSLVNIDDYDYFLSDTMGLSFHNACNFFHGHTAAYKFEHISKGLVQQILKLTHLMLIKNEAEYYKNTKLCIIGSKEMKQDYIKNCGIAPDKIKILHPGKDNIIEADIKRKEQNEVFVIGSVTCGFQLKGGYNILRAVRKLKNELPPEKIKFKLIHPSYNKQPLLKLYLKFFGIDKYIDFLPYQNNINNFYASIDCLVSASNAEAFGRTITEAMISGIPVITGSNAGASDIINDGINGYIFEYGRNTSANLAAAIKRAYNERTSNQKLIENAYKTADKISWENFADELFNILTKEQIKN